MSRVGQKSPSFHFQHAKIRLQHPDLTTIFNATTLLNYDLAFDCAVVKDDLIIGACPWAQNYSLIDQVKTFKTLNRKGSQYGKFTASNALFVIWIGINDASIPLKNNQKNWETVGGAVASQLFGQLDILYFLGFRKFLLMNVPPYDRTPQVMNTGNITYINDQRKSIAIFNHWTAYLYQQWIIHHFGLDAYYFDTGPAFNLVLDHPTQFGANSTGAGCWGVLPDCLWADDFHPGPTMHRVLAEQVVLSLSKQRRFQEFFTLWDTTLDIMFLHGSLTIYIIQQHYDCYIALSFFLTKTLH